MSGRRRHYELRGASWALAVCLSVSACSPNFNPQGDPPLDPDQPAVIVAGDQTVDPGAWVRLDGSESYDPHGRELSYLWSQIGGPMVALESWRTPVASFNAPPTELGEPLVFELEVDNGLTTAQASTQVRVIHEAPPEEGGELNADAGPDQGVLSGEQVVLDGSSSSGPGDDPLEYEWTHAGGVPVDLLDADQALARFQAPSVEDLETLVFQLQVTQGDDSAVDEVVIVVIPSGGGDGQDPQCSDGIDNDGDGLVDYPVDPGCDDDQDDDEFSEENPPACSDGLDNDDDGFVDYPSDPGCEDSEDDDEFNEEDLPACSDDIDNDEDGLTDYPDDPGCESTDDDDEEDPPGDGREVTLYSSLRDEEDVQSRYDEWGLQRVVGFSGWCISIDGDYYFSEEERTIRMEYCLENFTPDENYDGFLMLDWESPVFEVLKEGPDHPDHAVVVGEMLGVLEYVKQRRPLAKVGYYGLPLREYWDQDSGWWREAAEGARPILDASGVLFPSVYDFYGCSDDPEHGNYQCARDLERHGNVVRLALEYADGKPVLPYTWHRWHNSTEQWGFFLIDSPEYIQHVRHLVHNVEYNGAKVDGIVAWGATQYYYNYYHEQDEHGRYTRNDWQARRGREAFAREMLPDETIDEYAARLHPRVYTDLAEALFGE